MRKLVPKICLALTGLIIISCSISPVAIDYDQDQCHACKMTISDSRFGAELVTKKGKIYKFDAAECMVREVNKKGEDQYAYIMVTDFSQPKSLIDARISSYLISKKLPSPMGANLSVYSSEANGAAALEKNGGKIFTWEELKAQRQFNNR